MKYTLSPLGPVIAGITLLLLGFVLNCRGGRPMLYGAMVLWGMGATALLLALILCLPFELRVIPMRLLMAAVGAVVLLTGALLAFVILSNNTIVTGTPDTVVVLGANLWNHKPSPILVARLETATVYLKQHPETEVVVTGGMGDDEPISEASCMAQFLEEHGIAPERIYQEDKATNTYENLKFTKALLEERGKATDHLLVVSSSAHLARVRMLAQRSGLAVSLLSAPLPGSPVYKLYFYMREGAALVKSFLMDRG